MSARRTCCEQVKRRKDSSFGRRMRRRSESGARRDTVQAGGFVGRVVAGPTCVARRSKRLGGNMNEPDRDHLPIRRGAFQGVSNRTLDGSQPDWNLVGHPAPPAGAPNVLLVLIDDAGFGNPEHLRRSDRHAELHADGGGGPAIQPLPRHRALLADAGGAADRSQQPRRRLRLDRRVLGRVPRLHGVRCRGTARRSRGSCGTTATAPPRSASGT